MNLYEIQAEILDCIDTDTGEIIDAEKLDGLQMAKAEKIQNIVLWIKNLRADEAALEAEEKAFKRRKQVARNKRESLTAYLTGVLDGEKVKADKFSISWTTSYSTEVVDKEQIPAHYWRHQEPELNRGVLLQSLRAGVDVPGVKLAEKKSIVIK